MARDFDGSTDRIDYASIQDVANQAQTFAAWVYPDADNVSQYVFHVGPSGDGTFAHPFWFADTGLMRFTHTTDDIDIFRSSSGAVFSTGSWQHFVWTWDGGLTITNIHMYVNGSEVAYAGGVNGTGNQIAATGTWSLGARVSDDLRNINGRIAAPGWWNRVLGLGEITGLVKGYSPLFYLNGLQFAPDLIRNQRDEISGQAGTLDGTTVIAHPSIIFPANVRVGVPVVGGITVFASISDGLGISDTVVTKTSYIRSVADNVGISDVLIRIATYIRSLSSNLVTTDTINTASNLKRSIAENVGVTDTVTTKKFILVVIADNLGITDVITRTVTFIRLIPDTLGVTDVISTIGTFIRNVADGVGITDVISRIGTFIRSESDNVGVSDTVIASKGVSRSITDDVGITDVIAAVLGKLSSIADSLGITDVLTFIKTTVISGRVFIAGVAKSLRISGRNKSLTVSGEDKSLKISGSGD